MKESGSTISAVQAEPKKSAEQKIEKTRETEPRIYIGPNFKGMVSGTVLKNGLPPALNEVICLCPAIGELVIPVKNLVQTRKELEKPDSAMRHFFRQAELFCLTYIGNC